MPWPARRPMPDDMVRRERPTSERLRHHRKARSFTWSWAGSNGGKGIYSLLWSRRGRRPRSNRSDAGALTLEGDVWEALGELEVAEQLYVRARTRSTRAKRLAVRLERLRARIELAGLPAEYQAIPGAPQITRAQLAALLGVHFDGLLRRAQEGQDGHHHRHAGPLGLSVGAVGGHRERHAGQRQLRLPAQTSRSAVESSVRSSAGF